MIIKSLEKDQNFLKMSYEEQTTKYRDIQNCIKNIQEYDAIYDDLRNTLDKKICTEELLKKILSI